MFMNITKSSRILGVAFALAVIIPVGMAEAAAGRGGRGNGGGGSDGGGDGLVGKLIITHPDYPKITYIVKKDGCEIRTCEIENGIRKCSTDLTDIKVCATKRS
jgi:hypothetical protein